MSRLRGALKAALPAPVRGALRRVLHYLQRLGRWPAILWQVRGATWRDRLTLLASAAAAPVVALRGLDAWQDPLLLRDARVRVRGLGEFLLRARTDDLWHVLPAREPALYAAIDATLREGDVFVDAGANLGVYTVLAARRVGAGGRVLCFEMMPDTADLLERHVRLNRLDNVTVVRKALSRRAGDRVVAVVEAGKHGQASIARERASPHARRIEVPTTTLDRELAGCARVRLMKLDLEGAELDALHGAAEALQRTEALVYERWGDAGAASDPVARLLDAAGFDCERLDGNNALARRRD